MPSPEKITLRRAEPEDYEALHKIFSGRRAVEGTLELPLPSVEEWRRRLSEPSEATHQLVACVGGEVVGELTLWTYPTGWRRRHVGRIGMAVRDDWQDKAIGTALMEAAVDLADNWLDLTRIELWKSTPTTGRGSPNARSSGSRWKAPTGASPSATGNTLTRTPWPVSSSQTSEKV
jgi:putative acetyltransferase